MEFRMGIFGRIAAVCAVAVGLVAMPAAAQTPRRAQSAHGFLAPGYLGVGVADLTDDRVKALHLKDDQGLEVAKVTENSPASRAGLKEHDVILEVNGKAVESIEQFQSTIGESAPGAKVSLTVWRNGARQTLTATLEARPIGLPLFAGPDAPDAPMPPMPPVPLGNGLPYLAVPAESPVVGFLGLPLTPQLADYFGVKDGVLVSTVYPHTPAERAGLKAGDVVTKVNGTPVMSPREISGVVRSAGKKAVSFTVVRNKKEITLSIEISRTLRIPAEKEAL
jgi:serine protease Do